MKLLLFLNRNFGSLWCAVVLGHMIVRGAEWHWWLFIALLSILVWVRALQRARQMDREANPHHRC